MPISELPEFSEFSEWCDKGSEASIPKSWVSLYDISLISTSTVGLCNSTPEPSMAIGIASKMWRFSLLELIIWVAKLNSGFYGFNEPNFSSKYISFLYGEYKEGLVVLLELFMSIFNLGFWFSRCSTLLNLFLTIWLVKEIFGSTSLLLFSRLAAKALSNKPWRVLTFANLLVLLDK